MELLDCDFVKLVDFVKTKYGLNLRDKKFLVQSRLTNYVYDCGYDDFFDYFLAVYSDPSGKEMANMINRLTTNHTYFMREIEHFKHLTDVFLREAEKNNKSRDLRIWSAGCSFGNEPYNLAMCIDEYFGERKKDWDCRILATDVSLNALRNAKNGIFPPQDLNELPPGWKEKYFVKKPNGTYQVTDKIRNDVIFKYHNLMEPIDFKKSFDLILCRNVMIYFDEVTKSALCKRFYNATNENGYLYIGHAESTPEDILYKKIQPAIFQKLSEVDENE